MEMAFHLIDGDKKKTTMFKFLGEERGDFCCNKFGDSFCQLESFSDKSEPE